MNRKDRVKAMNRLELLQSDLCCGDCRYQWSLIEKHHRRAGNQPLHIFRAYHSLVSHNKRKWVECEDTVKRTAITKTAQNTQPHQNTQTKKWSDKNVSTSNIAPSLIVEMRIDNRKMKTAK